MSKYCGYRYEKNGRYHGADYLDGVDQMFSYLKEQMKVYPVIKITDSDDYEVALAKNGHIVFPEYLALMDIRNQTIILADAFDPAEFENRLTGSGIHIDVPIPTSKKEAEILLEQLYGYYVAMHQN